jgi:hypothetical protein
MKKPTFFRRGLINTQNQTIYLQRASVAPARELAFVTGLPFCLPMTEPAFEQAYPPAVLNCVLADFADDLLRL